MRASVVVRPPRQEPGWVEHRVDLQLSNVSSYRLRHVERVDLPSGSGGRSTRSDASSAGRERLRTARTRRSLVDPDSASAAIDCST